MNKFLSIVIGRAALFFLFVQNVGGAGFSDETVSAGLDYLYVQPGSQFINPQPMMGGGAAAGDFDGDGWVDLYVTRVDGTDILFRNRGDGTFEDVSANAGFSTFLPTNDAAWGDVDNDGDLDLYVTSFFASSYYLYINDGQGHFTEEAYARGAAVVTTDAHFGFSVTMGDFNRDGWLDIYVTEWKNQGLLSTNHSVLLRNRGAVAPGHFTDVTDSAGVRIGVGDTVYSFSASFSDLDNDGWPDLAIAADFGTSRLFWNNGDGTFTDGTGSAGVATDENGMGSTFGDYDGDGLLDWFVTSIYDPGEPCSGCNWGVTGNRLYRNLGNRTFSDQTDAAGVRNGDWGLGRYFSIMIMMVTLIW